jgi:putative transposase
VIETLLAEHSYLTFRYRIKNTSAEKRLAEMAVSCNQVWNYCGGIQNDSKRLNRRWPSGFDLIKLTNGATKELGLHSDTVQAVCKQFAISRDKAKRRPKWRVSFGKKRSLGWVPFQCDRPLKVDGDTVTMLGKSYRLWLSRPIPPDIRSGSFSQDASGRWFLNLVCRVENDRISLPGEIGIDLGLKDFAALSTGEIIANPRHLRKSAGSLAKAQRAGRKRRARAIHRKVAAQRRDFLHNLSTRIARENTLVVVGNVNSSALTKTKMAKSVLDAGWSSFRGMLQYKMAMRPGAVFVEANERMSTQTCSDCSTIGGPKGLEGLRVRTWECSGCGSLHDRDVNASLNILRTGRSIALQCAEISVL